MSITAVVVAAVVPHQNKGRPGAQANTVLRASTNEGPTAAAFDIVLAHPVVHVCSRQIDAALRPSLYRQAQEVDQRWVERGLDEIWFIRYCLTPGGNERTAQTGSRMSKRGSKAADVPYSHGAI